MGSPCTLHIFFLPATGYSVLQIVMSFQRHTGYFLIQIYLPCTLLVVLSWVGFWLNREATSDRVGLGKKNRVVRKKRRRKRN